MYINVVHLCGNLTRDVQVKFLQNDKAVASFGLATNHKFKAADGTTKEEVTFVDIEAWGKTAELCGQYLTKGAECYVQGRLKLDTWEKDGQKQSKLRVVAEVVQFGRKANGQETGERPASAARPTSDKPAGEPKPASPPSGDDEPPF